jgi:hypothetical protein
MQKYSYDPACEELARHFLGDLGFENMTRDLAQHVQDTVELWLECEIAKRGGTPPVLVAPVEIIVNGTRHNVADTPIGYDALFALAFPDMKVISGATVVYHWRGKGDAKRDGTIYADKKVKPADEMQFTICFTGNA